MENLIADPTTTIRRYSLFAEAYQREQDALKEWIQAGAWNEFERSAESEAQLIQAEKKLSQAIKDRQSVVRKTFPVRVDGSNSKRRPVKDEYSLTAEERGNGITDFTFTKKGQ